MISISWHYDSNIYFCAMSDYFLRKKVYKYNCCVKSAYIFFLNEMLFSFISKSNIGFFGGKGQEQNTTESYKEKCNDLPGIHITIWRRV